MDEKDINHLIEEKLRLYTHPIDKEDFAQVKAVLDHHGRVRWLINSAKVWLIAAMSVITFLTIGLDGVKSILRKFIS